jgi:hypothetical protein
MGLRLWVPKTLSGLAATQAQAMFGCAWIRSLVSLDQVALG